MRIVELRAENLKRLKAVEIKPDGDVVVIAGRNAQGKTSVLDAIWMALAGAAGAKETTRPIRDGEKEASVELNLGDLVVTRRWTEKGTTLAVAAADGAKYPSPQSVLDKLIGRLTFDPLAFAEAPQKDQLATLLSVVELPFDPAHLAMERQGIYDQRTEVGRELKRLEGALSEIPVVPDDTPDEETIASEIAAELGDLERKIAQRDAVATQVKRDEETVIRLERELRQAKAAVTSGGETLAGYEGLEDPEMYQQELDRIDETNAAVRAKKDRARVDRELGDARAQISVLSGKLLEIDRRKEEALGSAKMPLEGLSFDDDGVLFNGIPLSQVSDSERLRVSIAIAMALNPEIRVIRITDGSLLDSHNLELLAEMCAEHDFQCWLEKVDESGEVGITIEDGAVA